MIQFVPVDPARNVADPDPPSRPVAQPSQPSQISMDGSQLVQWLSVQASMACDLQRNVRGWSGRVLPCLSRTDMMSLKYPAFFKILNYRNNSCAINNKLTFQTMLRNQVLAIDTFQKKWQQSEDCPKENASLGTVHEFQCMPCIEFLAISLFSVPMLSHIQVLVYII